MPDERVPGALSSTPSAQLVMHVVFSDAQGQVLFDNQDPLFAHDAEQCPERSACRLHYGNRITKRGGVTSGMGNSKEEINRLLHELVPIYFEIATCQYERDVAARANGGHITLRQADDCGYENLYDAVADGDKPVK